MSDNDVPVEKIADLQERRDRQQHPMFLILLPFLGSGFVPTARCCRGLPLGRLYHRRRAAEPQ
jgi:hypothetical protein